MPRRPSLPRRLWCWLTLLLTGCAGTAPLPTAKPPLPAAPPVVALAQVGGRPLAAPLTPLSPATIGRAAPIATLGAGALRSAVWLPDGALVADTALSLVRVDPRAGPSGPAFGPRPPLRLLAALPDGRLLLGGDNLVAQRELALWDPGSSQSATLPIPPAGRVFPAPDGALLALSVEASPGSGESPADTGRLVVIDSSGRELLTLAGRFPGTVAFSPDGRLLAMDAVDYSSSPPKVAVEILELPGGRVTRELRGLTYVPDALGFLPGTPLLLVRENGGATSVWDTTDGSRQRDLGALVQTAADPTGRRLVAFDGAALRLWELPAWRELGPLSTPPDALAILADVRGATLALSPDGARLLASGPTGLAVWEVGAPDAPPTIHPFTEPLRRVAFAPNGAAVATAGGAATTLWDLASGRPIWHERADSPAFAFAPGGDGLLLTARGPAGDLIERRSLDGAVAEPLAQPGGEWALALSPSGTSFVGGFQRQITLRDAASGAPLRTIEAPATLSGGLSGVSGGTAPAFSPDGTLLAAGVDEQARVWDAADGRELRRLTHESAVSRVRQVAFSPGGATLATVALDGVILWDVAASRKLRTITTGETDRFVERVAFSPDGSLLAAGTWLNGNAGAGGDVRVWEVASGRLLATLPGHLGEVGDVAFSPDGSLLASAAADGTVRLWAVME